MKLIRFLSPVVSRLAVYRARQVAELPDELAEQLIRAGQAELAEEPTPEELEPAAEAEAEAELELAAVEPRVELAVRSPRKRRRS